MGTERTIPEQLLDLFDQGHRICTDSRKIKEGDLYFALKGERFDGNDYAMRALEAGAKLAIVDSPSLVQNQSFFHVPDVLKALQDLAREHRRRLKGHVLGLTGSNGKTTTKELLKAVLSRRYKTYATVGNLNNHIGVPLTLLSIPRDAEFVVIEMGANHVGEIRELAEIAEPNSGFITNIGLAHLEGFGGAEGVKRGKRELFEFIALQPNGQVFINASKPVLMEISELQERILFGTTQHPPYTTRLEQQSPGHCAFEITDSSGRRTGPFQLRMDGEYNLENALAAMAIGSAFGVNWEECIAAVEGYQPTNNRSQWEEAARNRVLLDAYNANPSSVELAVHTFAAASHPDPLLILGDMAELGDYAKTEHQRIAQIACETGIETWLVGSDFEQTESHPSVRTFSNCDALLCHLEDVPLANRTILLKGSRSMELEKVVPLL